MNFSEALKQLKLSVRVFWGAWSANKWIAIVGNNEYSIDIWKNAKVEPISIKTPWIGMRYGVGEFAPWIATYADLLEDDWQILTEPFCEDSCERGSIA